MSGQSRNHPALTRFMARDRGTARLLLIKAAAGTGRGWFARSWIGDRTGEVHDWSDSSANEEAKLEVLITRLCMDPSLVIAVILPPSAILWDLVSLAPSLVAEQRDLLLEAGELAQLAGGPLALDPELVQRVYGLSGGWLDAALLLAENPTAHFQAKRVIRSALAVWLQHMDPGGTLSEAAFLQVFGAETIETYYGEFSPVVHTLDDLVEVGLVQSAGQDCWAMPELVRQVLIERVGSMSPERKSIMENAATAAIAAVHGIPAAADLALQRRRWPALQDLLLNHWADMYISNPRGLGALIAKVPRFLIEQTDYMRVGMRILSCAGKDGMVLQLPAFAPDYASDPTAQRLRQDAARLYRRPNARALTVGMLEMFHLRLGGFYEEAGNAALRLREALHRALDEQRLSPVLAALAEFHAGLSLHLAGREAAALQSYQAAFHWAQVSGKAFLLADIAGKMALLHALEGQYLEVSRWLREHDAVIGDVGWGRKMIARAASMARAYVAMADIDSPRVWEALGTLPGHPDNDELWAVHAHLLAMHRIQAGIPEAARALIESLQQDRRHAATAPLAKRLLSHALLMAATLERGTAQLELADGRGGLTLVAFGHLLGGEPDAALAVLTSECIEAGGRRRENNLALYLELAARNPSGPTPQALERLQRHHKETGILAEISLLRMVPGWTDVAIEMDLAADEIDRLKSSVVASLDRRRNRPTLTSRENDILRQLRAGLTRRQIAEAGYRSENTVKTQMRSLYRKLGASTLDEALECARDLGL